ncbi:MAG: tRNA (N6-isopentenyl adenosine(37)-C2)-methylthiotransferase MiaB [Oscillospiraceae bacterium]|nr:tRNA (N6-isopentenyl adenosine(37)-C2)-methylthiotransferase MiaB [Oscillospiraceae bacterium]
MENKTAFIPAEDIARQAGFEKRIRDMFALRGREPKAVVDTFGCQQNAADSERIMGMLGDMGFSFTDDPSEADVVVLNTCAVREHAEKRVYGNLGALTHTKKANPDQIICLCGCMAQEKRVADKVRESYRHVDLVFGPHALWKFPELLSTVYTHRGRVFSIDDERGAIAEGLPVVREDKVKAWVSIMYGCNNFCSYCIVPYVRGRERSRAADKIIDEVRSLVADCYRDITLLGQNVNSYGKDLGEGVDFTELLNRIDAIDGDYVVRFMTSHPKDASPRLFDAMAQSRHIERHLHLPFQSGNDRVLAAMRRGYTRASYLSLVNYARSVMPDIVLTSDVIVGFPGETEEEFGDTLSLIKEVGFDALFTFIYSPRPGTPAAEMEDDTPHAEKQRRFDALLAAQNDISAARHSSYIGKEVRVLVDGESGDARWPLSARTNGGRLVHLAGDKDLIGNFAEARITGSSTWALFGEAE